MIAALVLRLYGIERIPPVVIHDECDNLVNVYQILNHRGPGFFGFDWKPQPAANVYVLSVFMRAGMSILALRLPTVLYSVAVLLPFYLLARPALRAPAALCATLLLTTDLLAWLEPSIRVDQFPRWQADIIDWTAHRDAFINLDECRAVDELRERSTQPR